MIKVNMKQSKNNEIKIKSVICKRKCAREISQIKVVFLDLILIGNDWIFEDTENKYFVLTLVIIVLPLYIYVNMYVSFFL